MASAIFKVEYMMSTCFPPYEILLQKEDAYELSYKLVSEHRDVAGSLSYSLKGSKRIEDRWEHL